MNIYDIKVINNEQKELSLGTYKGKVLLIVNTATKCGLTPQYEGLEKLYQTYKDQGFEILDFPSNQFLNQAPGTDKEIQSFCTLNYQTTFPRFSKINVNGTDASPLYKYLKKVNPQDDPKKKSILSVFFKSSNIKWNFAKFLVNKDGEVIYRFAPSFLPEDIAPYIKGTL